ncbi:MAG: ring-opening amidohydrolase [Hyphomicrobiales bacterium]
MREARTHRISAAAPDDMSGLDRAIADGRIDPAGIVAILGKTEGNGCVNDFTRAFAVSALKGAVARHAAADGNSICYVMSGGTEGGLSPHWLVLERREGKATTERSALAVGRARTRELKPEEIGRIAQVEAVAEGVRAAMADAGIDDGADIHFVQIKCPLLTAERVLAAETRGERCATRDTLESMSLSRAASALGIGVALGEIEAASIGDDAIGKEMTLWSGRASASAGVELHDHEIVVLGMSSAWGGPLAVNHAVMADPIDIEPVRDALARLGLPCLGQVPATARSAIVGLLAKAEAGSTGLIRGRRHTMLDDSDIASTRHARAFVGGALAGLVGFTDIFVSGGAEHQGPDGGGPVAIIVDRSKLGGSP